MVKKMNTSRLLNQLSNIIVHSMYQIKWHEKLSIWIVSSMLLDHKDKDAEKQGCGVALLVSQPQQPPYGLKVLMSFSKYSN